MNKIITWIGAMIAIICLMTGYIQKIRKKSSVLSDTEKEAWNYKLSYRTITIGIVILGALLRIWKLADYPAGINCDEIGMAYDAYCLANYGVDRFLNPYPMYLINYGGGQSVVYANFCAVLFQVFGVSLYTIRMPAVLAGMAVIVLSGAITREIFGKKTAVVAMLLTTACPYFIMTSRFGLDCNLFLSFAMGSFYLLMQAVKRQKKKWFCFAGLAYGITLYTYSLSWIIIPVFLGLTVIYLFYCKKITIKQLFALGVPMGILVIPLFLFLYINTFQKGSIITPFFSIPQLPQYRAGDFSFENIDHAVKVIRLLLTEDQSQFFSYDNYYTMYAMSIPFILLGFFLFWKKSVACIEQRKMHWEVLVLFYFLAALLNAVLLNTPNIYRNNSIYFPFALFAAVAIMHVCGRFHAGKWIGAVLLGLYGLHLISFAGYYYSDRVREDHPVVWFNYDYIDDIFVYIKENKVQRQIYVDDMNISTYCYAMLINEVSPYDFAAEGNDAYTEKNNYNNLHFYLPEDAEQIDQNAIYIVMEANPGNDIFMNTGFQVEKYGYFYIYY